MLRARAAALLAFFLATRVAGAQELPRAAVVTDVLVLRGGETLRGTIIEAIVGDHATLRLPDGRTAIV